MQEKQYRPNVAAIIINADRLVFLGEVAGHRNRWQFPQGGIRPGELPEEALFRELKEEVGTDRFSVLAKFPGLLRYEFPSFIRRAIRSPYCGQEQQYYLCRFEGEDAEIALELRELTRFQWVAVDEVLPLTSAFKQEVYTQALSHFRPYIVGEAPPPLMIGPPPARTDIGPEPPRPARKPRPGGPSGGPPGGRHRRG